VPKRNLEVLVPVPHFIIDLTKRKPLLQCIKTKVLTYLQEHGVPDDWWYLKYIFIPPKEAALPRSANLKNLAEALFIIQDTRVGCVSFLN